MRKLFLFFAFSLFISICGSRAAVVVYTDPVPQSLSFSKNIASLSIKEIQHLLGRKLSLKEKIAVKVYQIKFKKGLRTGMEEKPDDTGKIALVLGIAGLVLLACTPFLTLLPAAIATILALILGYKAKRRNPEDKKAKAAIVLGWITVGIFIVFAIFVVLSFAGGFGWG